MNRRECLWAISSDVIDLFQKDFGMFHSMAKKIAYENIQEKPDKEINRVVEIIRMRISAIDEHAEAGNKRVRSE